MKLLSALRRHSAGLLLALVGLTPSLVSAQTTTTPDGGRANQEVLTLSPFLVNSARDYGYRATNTMTATRIGVPIHEMPQDIAVITSEFLHDIGTHQFTDVMRYTSNVTVSVGEPDMTNSQASPVIRGFAAPFILRNGFRRDRTIIPFNIDRVEIVKGPASTFFSQQAPGGVINYITKRPSFTPSAAVEARVGSFDFKDANVELTGPLGNSKTVAYRLVSMIEDSEDWREWEYNKTKAVNGALLWQPTKTLSIWAEGEYVAKKINKGGGIVWGANEQWFADWKAAGLSDQIRWYGNLNQWAFDKWARTGTFPDVITRFYPELLPKGFRSNLNGPDAFRDDKSYSGTVEGTWTVNDALSLRYGGNVYRIRYDRQNIFQDTVQADGTFNIDSGSAQSPAVTNNATSIFYAVQQVDAVYDFNLGAVKNTIVVGAEYWWDKKNDGRRLFDTTRSPQPHNPGRGASPYFGDLGSPFRNYLRAYNPFVDRPLYISEWYTGLDDPQNFFTTNERKGYYASYRGKMLQDRLNISAGVRKEKNDQYTWTRTLTNSGYTSTTHVLSSTKGTTPTGGISYALTPDLNLYAGYSTSFEPNAGLTVTGSAALPGEGLPLGKKKGRGLDIGVKSRLLDGKLTGTLSFFDVKQDGVAIEDTGKEDQDPRNVGRNFSNYVVRFFSQTGAYHTRGVDLDLLYTPIRNYQLVVAGSLIPTAEIEAIDAFKGPSGNTGRLADGSVVQLPFLSAKGQRMEKTPKYMFSFWNKYTFVGGPLKGLSLGAGAHFVGALRPRGGNGNGVVTVRNFYVPSYEVFDVMANYGTKFGSQPVTFTLQVKNVFDKFYIDSHTTAGDPRKLYFTTRLDF